jgi:ethanolamine utilization microcompartment shell protein EutS
MAFAETQVLTAELRLDDKMTGGLTRATSSLNKLGLTSGKVRAALGATLGAGLGIMLSGAEQLDAATRQLQADTGMYRCNLQGFDQISAAMARVHNDLGLTGEMADKTTAAFLKFATATGQDAAASVAAFDDILDAWGLTAADAQIVMDKLVASHQKYGGSIAENEDALSKLAPQLLALNVGIDGGIALLNMFEASGLDSSKAMFALNYAVKQLKPGQSLDDLIRQVTAIEDPTQRAQKAIELFGARGGVGLANVLRPGVKGLGDFAMGAREVAGATTRAADAIESGLGAQFQLLIKNAGGALADFGTQFGPLLMVAGAFGPKFVAAIGAGLGGLAGVVLPRVLGAITAAVIPAAVAGEAVGTAASGGIATGLAAGLRTAIPAILAGVFGGAAIALGGDAIPKGVDATFKRWMEKQAQGTGPAADYAKQWLAKSVATGAEAAVPDMSEAILGALDSAAAAIPASVNAAFAIAATDASTAATRAGMNLGLHMMQALADAIRAGKDFLLVAADDVATTFRLSLGGVIAASARTGTDGMLAMAGAIAGARQKPLDAFETLKQMLKHQMTRSAEGARLAGQLTSKELAEGLRSRDPVVRAQAEATKKGILERIEAIAIGTVGPGKKAMAELHRGMKSKDPEIRAASKEAHDAVMSKLKGTKDDAGKAGAEAGAAFAAGIAGATAISQVATGIGSIMEMFSLGLKPGTPPGAIPSRAGDQLADIMGILTDTGAETELVSKNIATVKSSVDTNIGATRDVARAIRSKDWSPTITVPVTVNTAVSIRTVVRGAAVTGRYGSTRKSVTWD